MIMNVHFAQPNNFKMRKRFAFIYGTIAVLLCTPAMAQRSSSDRSVFQLYAQESGEPRPQNVDDLVYVGTAILLDDDGYFLTARHNVNVNAEFVAKYADDKWGTKSPGLVKLEKVAAGRGKLLSDDWALLHVVSVSDAGATAWRIPRDRRGSVKVTSIIGRAAVSTPRATYAGTVIERMDDPEIIAAMENEADNNRHSLASLKEGSDVRATALTDLYAGYSGSAFIDWKTKNVHGMVSRSIENFDELDQDTGDQGLSQRVSCIMRANELTSLVSRKRIDTVRSAKGKEKQKYVDLAKRFSKSEKANGVVEVSQKVLNITDRRTIDRCNFKIDGGDSLDAAMTVDHSNQPIGSTIELTRENIESATADFEHLAESTLTAELWGALWHLIIKDIKTTRFVLFSDKSCVVSFYSDLNKDDELQCSLSQKPATQLLYSLGDQIFQHAAFQYSERKERDDFIALGGDVDVQKSITSLYADLQIAENLPKSESVLISTKLDLIESEIDDQSKREQYTWNALQALFDLTSKLIITDAVQEERVLFDYEGEEVPVKEFAMTLTTRILGELFRRDLGALVNEMRKSYTLYYAEQTNMPIAEAHAFQPVSFLISPGLSVDERRFLLLSLENAASDDLENSPNDSALEKYLNQFTWRDSVAEE